MTLQLHETLLCGERGPFISTWRTAAAGETITLPLSGGAGSLYNFVVYWGDGTNSVVTSATDVKRIHAYAAPGDYKVKITGVLVGWAFNNTGDKLKIRSIDQWGVLRFTVTQAGHFYGCTNLVVATTDVPLLSPSCVGMFQDCAAIVKIPLINNWDTSAVTSMSRMFSGASMFNDDMNLWNVSRVDNFSQMFLSAIAFNGNIDSWVTSSAKTITQMFFGATAFNRNISGWTTNLITNMSSVFYGASSFDQPIGSWNTSSATNMTSMFRDAAKFNQNISAWVTSKVTAMNAMFSGAKIFNKPIGGWDTAAVLNMSQMFSVATAFNQDLNLWNVQKVTNMSAMFNGASAFNGNISNWVVSSVSDMNLMFYSAISFNGDIGNWNTGAATSMTSMFNGASSFNCGQPAGTVHVRMKRTATGGWRIGGITSASLVTMFSNASAFAGDISTWCADAATTAPTNFAFGANANFTPALRPTWGVCPIPD